jgi:hypothetical protein
MPFGNDKHDPDNFLKLNSIYEDWIQPTVEKITTAQNESITCHRADKAYRTGEIITHVIENIVESYIVIADLTGKNANVFYELGVRHAVSNNTILISEEVDDIPFDLKHLRTISYKYTPDKMLKFQKDLEKAIQAIFNSPDEIDNPVRRFLHDMEVKKIINTPITPDPNFLKALITEMSALKEDFATQVTETKNLVKSITENNKNLNVKHRIHLDLFEGLWISNEDNSHYYPKVIDQKLYIPYCHKGNDQLSAHMYECAIIGNVIFAKFKWFDSVISGSLYLRIVNENKLDGEWWFEDELPDLHLETFALDKKIANMHRITLIRKQDAVSLPEWVKQYYRKIESGNRLM